MPTLNSAVSSSSANESLNAAEWWSTISLRLKSFVSLAKNLLFVIWSPLFTLGSLALSGPIVYSPISVAICCLWLSCVSQKFRTIEVLGRQHAGPRGNWAALAVIGWEMAFRGHKLFTRAIFFHPWDMQEIDSCCSEKHIVLFVPQNFSQHTMFLLTCFFHFDSIIFHLAFLSPFNFVISGT